MLDIFAVVATFILVLLTVFQLALILGAPLGKYSWGGQHTKLTPKLKIASSTSIILYGIFIIFILSKAEILDLGVNQDVLNVGMWVFTVYFFIGILLNTISRSKPERNVMTPTVAILAILFLFVALG